MVVGAKIKETFRCGLWIGLMRLAVCLVFLACTPLSTASEEPPCEIGRNSIYYQEIETLCDNIDNDCDQMTDLLQPVEENRCTTERLGACQTGFFGCVRKERVCLTPPETPEVRDGIDNDCNGTVDDVPEEGRITSRAKIIVPPYLCIEGEAPASKTTLMLLDQMGIPYDISLTPEEYETSFDGLESYALIIIPGYTAGYIFDTAKLEKLEAFVEKGGVLIWQKVIPDSYSKNIMRLAGIQSGRDQKEVETVLLDRVPAGFWLDSPEESEQRITDDALEDPVEVFVYEPDTEAEASSFGRAFDINQQPVGDTFVRRPLGKGAVYTLGHNPEVFGRARGYVNHYDPGYDLYGLFLKGAFREGTRGHYVVKHTVPGVEGSVLVVSHDLDAPESHLYGNWGEPGALQMAQMEYDQGVKGTNFVTTDYYVGYYNPLVVQGLCDLGMCPEGGHSVLHGFMREMPLGDCTVTQATYDLAHPTVCGEIRVCHEILSRSLPENHKLYAWRTPYLNTPPDQWEILYSEGVLFDSSLGFGDLLSNFPVYLKTYPWLQEQFRGLPMFQFAITIEDGFGTIEDGQIYREELKSSTRPKFLTSWSYAIRQNARNGAWTVLLVHPSFGLGCGYDNLGLKVEAVKQAIITAKEAGALIEPLSHLGLFSLGRETASLEAEYASGSYQGSVYIGSNDAPRFSLEFGDHIAQFDAPGAPEAIVEKNRVVFNGTLKAGQIYPFSARVN